MTRRGKEKVIFMDSVVLSIYQYLKTFFFTPLHELRRLLFCVSPHVFERFAVFLYVNYVVPYQVAAVSKWNINIHNKEQTRMLILDYAM